MRSTILAAFLVLGTPAWAAEAFLALDANRIEAGQGIGLSLILKDGEAAGSVPQIRAEGLAIAHTRSQNEIRRIDHDFTRLQVHQYRVRATEPGRYTIGPLELKLARGETATTNLVTLEVTERTTEVRSLSSPEATAELVPSTAWEGQIVLWTWSLHSASEIVHVEVPTPAFDGLRVVPYATPRDRVFQVSDPSGPVWRAERAVPLVAVATGRREQPGAGLRVTIPSGERSLGFGLRRDRREVVPLPPLTLDVRPLPPAPPGFSGLVGDFSLRSTLETRGAAVGSSLKWKIELAGDGDVGGFRLPPAAPSPDVQVYEADHGFRGILQDGRFLATATFDRSVVPVRDGRIAMPPLELVVFSPSSGQYETLRAEIAPFDVAAGREAAAGLESFARDVAAGEPVAGPAIRPLARRGRDHAPSVGPVLPFALALAAGPGLGVGLLASVERARSWREARRRAAMRPPTAGELLRRLPSEPEARLAALDGALRLALAARAGVAVAELDRAAAVAALPQPLAAEVAEVGRRLDRARFAGEPGDDLVAAVEAVVAKLA